MTFTIKRLERWEGTSASGRVHYLSVHASDHLGNELTTRVDIADAANYRIGDKLNVEVTPS